MLQAVYLTGFTSIKHKFFAYICEKHKFRWQSGDATEQEFYLITRKRKLNCKANALGITIFKFNYRIGQFQLISLIDSLLSKWFYAGRHGSEH